MKSLLETARGCVRVHDGGLVRLLRGESDRSSPSRRDVKTSKMELSSRRTQWLHRVVMTMLCVVTAATLLGCGTKEQLRCAFADIARDLKSADAAMRAQAANCLRRASSDEAAKHVPTLLGLMGDKTVYWRGKINRPLLSFGNDGEEGELPVALPATYAVRRATPLAANVEPLVRVFVDSANQIGADRAAEGLWGDPRTVYRELMELMRREYRGAGLRAQIEAALERELPKIVNLIVWDDIERIKELDELTAGRSPVVQSNLQRLNAAIAARAAHAEQPPALRPLPDGEASKGKYSVRVWTDAGRQPVRGMTWSRHAIPPTGDWALIGCHGAVKDGMSAPHDGSCNPYRGDTVCEALLPVLCVVANTGNTSNPTSEQVAMLAYKLVDARVAVTKPVVGSSLASQAVGDAVCARSFGKDWRMAQFHDAGGWGLAARASRAEEFPLSRYWVAIHDQPANCWNR
jgi:hypothetical protein